MGECNKMGGKNRIQKFEIEKIINKQEITKIYF
jgi:hypothetical protein